MLEDDWTIDDYKLMGAREFANDHLSWVHQIERMANHRLTDREIHDLWAMSLENDFDTRIEQLNTLTDDVNEASRKFVEGLQA